MEMLNNSILRCGNIKVRHQKLGGGAPVHNLPPAPAPMYQIIDVGLRQNS